MEYIIILIICIIVLFLLRFILGVNIKKIKQLSKNKELDKLTNEFPENIEIAKSILQKLKNKAVKIEEQKESKTSLYLIMTNKIVIANIRDSYTRVQTIAHECLHSVQSKRTLWFNYLFSNFYLIYFILLSILTIIGIVKQPIMQIFVLMLLGVIYYVVRSILETDAMTKARYVAKEYLEENQIGDNQQREKLIQAYDNLNQLGIPAINYMLLRNVILKVIFYIILVLIFFI